MGECGRDLWRWGVSGAVFPLHERLKGHDTVRRRRLLERTQWYSAEAVTAIAGERLRKFLTRVEARVPFYRERFRVLGVDPRRMREVADLAALPLTDKASMRAAGEQLRADGAPRLRAFHTGGSTGEPFAFFLGRERLSHDVAAKWRATRWWGVDIGDPEIVLWGSPIELGAQDRFKGWRDRLLRSRLLPAFAMSPQNMGQFCEAIRRARPRMLFGYPSSLALLARHAAERGISLDGLGIRVAFVTGERLYPEQSEAIARTFACPVANGYGSRDAGFIAHACPEGGLHISAEDVIVEIVDETGRPVPAGVTGELVVTHTATADFPFIRYRTGDMAAIDPAPCGCGRGLPCLKRVEGRATDFVVASDGTVMHGLALIYVLREEPAVARFKIVQESRTHTRLLLVPACELTVPVCERIRAGLRARLGEDVTVELEEVAEIPPERSGKYRYVVSHVGEAA
ncbi:phenylacetate--CoA ligase family protein [Arhodomonas sp. SL1]|uniref:phenylacetate--CoA ligase family protein n=1 Tax=Arhodomonas sp. SL1 TaxID=3425691 RepID=UPI003F88282C